MEKAGLPSVALLSSEFKGQAEYQAHKLGLAQVPRAFVQHPISDQTQAQLIVKADSIFDEVVDGLTKNVAVAPTNAFAVPAPDAGGACDTSGGA